MILENSSDCPNCGNLHKSKPFCIYHDGYHCFSCGYHKRSDRSYNPHYTELNSVLSGVTGELNTHFSQFSLVTQAWLTKYYITDEHVQKNHMFEVSEHGKTWLVMPSIRDAKIVFYQKRQMGERYIVSSGAKVSAYIRSVYSRDIVIVEDFISYCRVREHTNCICLFGTKLNEGDEGYIARYENVVVWLDNDSTKEINSGQIAAKKICKSLEYTLYYRKQRRGFTILDSRIENIVTEFDPKAYSDTEIKHILSEHV